MRILSSDPANTPLLGELSGRWYWDAHTGCFAPNRRHTERRHAALGTGGGLAYWRDMAVTTLLALNDYR